MNTKIIAINSAQIDKGSGQELVEDMMALIASFSGKLYGMRSRKGKCGNG